MDENDERERTKMKMKKKNKTSSQRVHCAFNKIFEKCAVLKREIEIEPNEQIQTIQIHSK